MVAVDSNIIQFRNLLALKILSSAPNKVVIKSLEVDQKQVTSDDLSVIGDMLIAVDLVLDYSVDAVRINGSETNIRRAMRMLLQDFQASNSSEVSQLVNEYPDLTKANQEMLLRLATQIKNELPELTNYSVSYLLTELYILLRRYSLGAPATHQLGQIFTSEQLALIQSSEKLFVLSQSLIKKISEVIGAPLSEIEIYYLTLKIWLGVQD
ncbi:hypothetical protein [Paucilactobacillus kaifaensis]|uniref:hypothetical protein n=1 Tax=Paucilactobacillus kaifaensis TaxID=2559921 RepID=UPI0010F66D08|nr:hypothetical protein [Paucilactobacillus kaifaensis]